MTPPAAKHDQADERRALNIHPGGWTVEQERPIATLLGSCVATCLYDPHLRLAGMNHFLLPNITKRKHARDDVVLSGDYAMEVLVNAMLQQGARKSRLVAKAFGGGTFSEVDSFAIGKRNAEFAAHWLDQENIPLLATDFGGTWSRKLIFMPGTGDAFCRRVAIRSARARVLLDQENAYKETLRRSSSSIRPGEKKIELF